jgi:tyrosyl-tRNA synthetase
MLVDDAVIWRYMELLSARSNDEIATLRADVVAGRADVVSVKKLFAREIVTRFHSAEAADAALARRDKVAKDELPEDIDEVSVIAESGALFLGKALALAGLAPSSSEGARLVKGGAVHVDHAVVKDEKYKLEKGRRYLVRVGSKNRRFAWLKVQ